MSECVAAECNIKAVARGLCSRHYAQWRSGKQVPGHDQPPRLLDDCSIVDCKCPAITKGLCATHYQRLIRGHKPLYAPIVTKLRDTDMATRLRTYAPEGAPDECWEWTRSLTLGYGAMYDGKRNRGAHILAWEVFTGVPVPKGLVVRHTCDNPPCTNPAHLLLGTHADNVADKVSRNRQQRGNRHALAKLNDELVREIRRRSALGEVQSRIAADLNVSKSVISSVVTSRTWAHVK